MLKGYFHSVPVDQRTQSSSSEIVESIIQCKFNFKMTCSKFHMYIMGKPELLKQVKKSEKYNISNINSKDTVK